MVALERPSYVSREATTGPGVQTGQETAYSGHGALQGHDKLRRAKETPHERPRQAPESFKTGQERPRQTPESFKTGQETAYRGHGASLGNDRPRFHDPGAARDGDHLLVL